MGGAASLTFVTLGEQFVLGFLGATANILIMHGRIFVLAQGLRAPPEKRPCNTKSTPLMPMKSRCAGGRPYQAATTLEVTGSSCAVFRTLDDRHGFSVLMGAAAAGNPTRSIGL